MIIDKDCRANTVTRYRYSYIFIENTQRAALMPSVSLQRIFFANINLGIAFANRQLLEIADRESCYRLVDRPRTNRGSLDTGEKKKEIERIECGLSRKIIPSEFLVTINSYRLQIQFADTRREDKIEEAQEMIRYRCLSSGGIIGTSTTATIMCMYLVKIERNM